jgi:YbgC/YbaW family acyl-CoA thioester hydrolase
MPRIYTLHHTVFNSEGDAWGQLQPSGVLRILETAAILAAAAGGYGDEFHAAQGTAWVIRRMNLLLLAPAHVSAELEIRTWASHFMRVRGGREYTIQNLTTGDQVARGIAEWVYVDRKSGMPRPIPPQVGIDFDVPGAPLGLYEAPSIASLSTPREFRANRKAEWYEADSMGHVNNTVYADWLDAAFRDAMEQMGWPVAAYKERGYQLRAEYIALEYKRPALPGDHLAITTSLVGREGRLCSVRQVITRVSSSDNAELASAEYAYGWVDAGGMQSEPPKGWPGGISSV